MKHPTKTLTIAILILALSALVSANTYNEHETIVIEGQNYTINLITPDGRIVLGTEHRDFSIPPFDCTNYDIYLICLDNITYDPVEHYPNDYELTITWERLCEDCIAWGEECSAADRCQGACVNDVCRPRSPWCGDGYCDEGLNERTCPEDCANNQTGTNEEDTQPAEQETTPEETQETPSATEDDATEDEAQETTEENTLGSDNQPSGFETPTTAQDDTNWLAAGLVVFGGLVLVLVIFNKKKKRKDDLYSYRK